MANHERGEALVRAKLTGLGFDLELQQRNYIIKDRQPLDLPSVLQPIVCDTSPMECGP
jgi:hypothetical protein